MIGEIFIENEEIGHCDFEIIDISMGVIAGVLIPNEAYKKYNLQIEKLTSESGNANLSDFNFKVFINDQEIVHEGGISISDFEEERYIDVAGISNIEFFK